MKSNFETLSKQNGYMTSQKRTILNFFSTHPNHPFSAEEICQAINSPKLVATAEQRSKSTGLSTIYRQIAHLCEDGILKKFPTEHGYVYQYDGGNGNCNHHFHLRCVICGKIQHLECQLSNQLLDHIGEEHGFVVDSGKSVLYGYCNACKNSRGTSI